jgi:hypothetical protein
MADVIMTLVLAAFLTFAVFAVFPQSKPYVATTYAIVTLLTFLLGIGMHRVFCVKTVLDRLLFP